jgi:uncharacterized membrane protein
MSSYHVALLLHLVGVIAYFSGLALATAGLVAARRRTLPSEIAAILALARSGALLVAAGMVVLVACGFWLVSILDLEFGATWLDVSIALFAVSFFLGGVGGQAPKRARRLAERLAGGANEPTDELRALLGHRPSDVLNGLGMLASLAVLVLMVWQPGG